MNKDLTTSPHNRQNILNNRYALDQAEIHLALGGIKYESGTVFTKQQVLEFNGTSLSKETRAQPVIARNVYICVAKRNIYKHDEAIQEKVSIDAWIAASLYGHIFRVLLEKCGHKAPRNDGLRGRFLLRLVSLFLELFEISERTLERYLSANAEELTKNGYLLLRARKLSKFKELAFGTVINDGTKMTVLEVFTFRAVLNLSMLLTEGERANVLRSRILDIVMDVIVEFLIIKWRNLREFKVIFDVDDTNVVDIKRYQNEDGK